MKIILVRHAQTDENVDGGLALQTSEVLLNEAGVTQAEKLANHLKHHKISHVYTGPLKRAVATAEKVLAHHPQAHFIVSEHLDEQALGEAATMPKAQWKEIKKNTTEPWHLFKAKAGESYQQMQLRVATFFHDLLSRHQSNDTIVIVSHGGPLGVLLLHLLEKELTKENYQAHQPKNTQTTIIEILEDGKKIIHEVNTHNHLL